MKNIEKYEEELKEYGTQFAITKEGVLVSCDEFDCLACLYKDSNCIFKKMEWLSQEYKEPILTEEVKEFLKQLIAPFISNKFVSIGINKDLETLRINYEIGWVSYPKKVLREKWDWFKNLNPEKLYTLEELGL